jgi:hypothetical protein
LTGEAVRRTLEQAGDSYTPHLYALKLFPETFRDALPRTMSPYMNGKGSLAEAIDGLVQALVSAAGGR